MNLAEGVSGVRMFSRGLADTSTLIYLRESGLLEQVVNTFEISTIAQVVREYGRQPQGCIILTDVPAGSTDAVVLDTAVETGLPLLSEDQRLLKAACRKLHPHYNSFMLLLALLARGAISTMDYHAYRDSLLKYARYSDMVIGFADTIYTELSKNVKGN